VGDLVTQIDDHAEWLALRHCAAAVIAAGDGRGVSVARLACAIALVRAGHSSAAAHEMACSVTVWAGGFVSTAAELAAQHRG
jgi:hypothetical protein